MGAKLRKDASASRRAPREALSREEHARPRRGEKNVVRIAALKTTQLCDVMLPAGGTLKLAAAPNAIIAAGAEASVAVNRSHALLMPQVLP